MATLRGDAVDHHAPWPETATFEVTACSLHGTTAAGTRARPGIVAADPTVLPLGSRIHILYAGAYSGVYRVEDTGRAIRGHRLDVYIANHAEAKRFGRRRLSVEMPTHTTTALHGKRLPKGKRVAIGGNRMDGVQQVEVRDVEVVAATHFTPRWIVGKKVGSRERSGRSPERGEPV